MVRWASGPTRHSTRLTWQAEAPQSSGECSLSTGRCTRLAQQAEAPRPLGGHGSELRRHGAGPRQHFFQAGSPYVLGGTWGESVTTGRQVETGRGMPRGIQSHLPGSASSSTSIDSFQENSEEALAPVPGRRVREVPEGAAARPYVEVQVLQDAASVAADITSHYDSMYDAVQRFTANEYGGSQFAIAIKDQTLEMLRRTMVARLDALIDVDAQLVREQRRVRRLKRQVRALQEEQEAVEETESRPRRSGRRSL